MRPPHKRKRTKTVKDEATVRNNKRIETHRKKKYGKGKGDDDEVEKVLARYSQLNGINTTSIKLFSDLPLSSATLKGLNECDYTEPTDIQRDSLPFSLTGSDLVGAAKTGSGKTLALVIPLLECLWRNRWVPDYGLGALIISPTRELALQTYSCINNVGKYHRFSCALLIGGTDVTYEKSRLSSVNIIVCTPGRLLQHMDENEQLSCDLLQMLVVDEADRILDMGFKQQINAIVNNLPSERQTLLFSATQTKNVKDLTRVCTKDPVFVSVHEHSIAATPDQLTQSYIVCEEEDKVNTLFSFLKMHRSLKTLVFVSSCRQARFLTEAYHHLRPGVTVMGLWGTMNQQKRIDVFQKFEDSEAAVLIATDVASRGLDFSDVHWVIQFDAPAAVDDYIHRVGRTARMNKKGHALMFLTESQEKGMVSILKQKNIPVQFLQADPTSVMNVKTKLQTILAKHPELNQFAQKSIVSYLRSIFATRDKSIFDVETIDVRALAASYGLMSVPRVRFLAKKGIKTKDKTNGDAKISQAKNSDSESSDNDDDSKKNHDEIVGKFDVEDEDDSNLFAVKSSDVFNVLSTSQEDEELNVKLKSAKMKVITRERAAKKIVNKGISVNTKIKFDEHDGTPKMSSTEEALGLDIDEAKKEIQERDAEDRKLHTLKQKRLKAVKKEKKQKKSRDDTLDLDEDGGGSGINSDADLDWLPDPDAVRKKYAEDNDEEEEHEEKPKRKRRRVDEIKKTEEEALALLNPL